MYYNAKNVWWHMLPHIYSTYLLSNAKCTSICFHDTWINEFKLHHAETLSLTALATAFCNTKIVHTNFAILTMHYTVQDLSYCWTVQIANSMWWFTVHWNSWTSCEISWPVFLNPQVYSQWVTNNDLHDFPMYTFVYISLNHQNVTFVIPTHFFFI
jgi:hypothetical protein